MPGKRPVRRSEPPTVQVRIGTVEIRATTPPASTPPGPEPPPSPSPQGFDDYVFLRNYVTRED